MRFSWLFLHHRVRSASRTALDGQLHRKVKRRQDEKRQQGRDRQAPNDHTGKPALHVGTDAPPPTRRQQPTATFTRISERAAGSGGSTFAFAPHPWGHAHHSSLSGGDAASGSGGGVFGRDGHSCGGSGGVDLVLGGGGRIVLGGANPSATPAAAPRIQQISAAGPTGSGVNAGAGVGRGRSTHSGGGGGSSYLARHNARISSGGGVDQYQDALLPHSGHAHTTATRQLPDQQSMLDRAGESSAVFSEHWTAEEPASEQQQQQQQQLRPQPAQQKSGSGSGFSWLHNVVLPSLANRSSSQTSTTAATAPAPTAAVAAAAAPAAGSALEGGGGAYAALRRATLGLFPSGSRSSVLDAVLESKVL
ncbi:MAG: hypothetical protein WDW38_001908 [Sanguina aurantia]